jgi:hypothetical protein
VDNTRGRRDDRDQDEAQAVFRVMLRPIAATLPLGFFAFMAGAAHPAGHEAGVRRQL